MMLFTFSIHCAVCRMEILDLAFLKSRFYPSYFGCLHNARRSMPPLYKITKLLFTPILLCNLINVRFTMFSTPEASRLRRATFPTPQRLKTKGCFGLKSKLWLQTFFVSASTSQHPNASTLSYPCTPPPKSPLETIRLYQYRLTRHHSRGTEHSCRLRQSPPPYLPTVRLFPTNEVSFSTDIILCPTGGRLRRHAPDRCPAPQSSAPC